MSEVFKAGNELKRPREIKLTENNYDITIR
jgi:hypothetical protein